LSGRSRKAPSIEDQGLGWKSKHGTGIGADAITGGLEVTWTQTPTQWSNHFFDNLFKYEWELTKSPAGAWQWQAKDAPADIPDPFDPSRSGPTMLTSDLALRQDPAYEKISRRFYENPDQFADAFARAWFKLTHRDMGPIQRYLGPLVPKETLIWQDPIPAVDHPLIGEQDIAALKAKILASGLRYSQLVSTAWASASTFRGSDKRGGANGARIRLAPQKDWEVNQSGLNWRQGAAAARSHPAEFNASATGGKKVSLADLIVLGGCAAIEKAAKDAGHRWIKVPSRRAAWMPRRSRPTRHSFAPLEPTADGFRNYYEGAQFMAPEEALVDRAQLLRLTGAGDDRAGRRPARAGRQCGQSKHGVFTHQPGNADERLLRQPARHGHGMAAVGRSDNAYEGHDRKTKAVKWTGTRVDLIFGSHSQLRALARSMPPEGSQQKLVKFVHKGLRRGSGSIKVMNADPSATSSNGIRHRCVGHDPRHCQSADHGRDRDNGAALCRVGGRIIQPFR
jgi:catalase-peroxidase